MYTNHNTTLLPLLLFLETLSHQVAQTGLKFVSPTIVLQCRQALQLQSTPPCPRQQRFSQGKQLLNLNFANTHGNLWKLCIYFVPMLKITLKLSIRTNIALSVTMLFSTQNTECQTCRELQKLEIFNQGTSAWSVTLNNQLQ